MSAGFASAKPAQRLRRDARHRLLRQHPIEGWQHEVERNGEAFERWPILTQETIVYFETPTAPTWQGQVEALRTWLKARLAWLDAEW